MNELMKTNNGLQSADPAAIAAAESAKQRIQTAYVMAYQKPRDVDQARVKILKACKRPMFAERVEYSKPVGGSRITGPSVRFAELALREWGNVLSDIYVVYEDDDIRRSKVIITDLETNTTFTKEVSVTKTVERRNAKDREIIGERRNSYGNIIYIVKATDEELHNKEAALISKALRNEGLRLIPSDIIDEAIFVARETLQNFDAKDPDFAKKRIADSFASIGISPSELKRYLGVPLDAISPAQLQELRGIYQAISAGDSKWSDYISNKPESTASEASDSSNPVETAKPKSKADKLKGKLKGAVSDAEKEHESAKVENPFKEPVNDEEEILTPPEPIEGDEVLDYDPETGELFE